MDRKQMCVANLRYKRPTVDEAKRTKSLLGYLTYRDSRDEGVKQVAGVERWTDHGMGGSVAEIAGRCNDLRSEHVLTFSLVINPNPQLMAMVAPEQREQFVRELTEATVEDFFEARSIDTGCEYSYVLHHRGSEDPQSPGMHNPHTHVVLPGTIWTEESGERVPLYFSQNKKVNHIEMLHAVTEQHMTDMLDRYVGLDWEQRVDAIEAVRKEQRQVISGEPHAFVMDDDGFDIAWNVWCGTRRTDEQTTAVGYYRYVPDPTDDAPSRTTLTFRPLLAGLPHDDAELLAHSFAQEISDSFEALSRLASQFANMTDDEQSALMVELRDRSEHHIPPPEIMFGIDF